MVSVKAQTSIIEQKMLNESFFNFQLQFDKVNTAYKQYYNFTKEQFKNADIPFPIEEIFVRAFKNERILEVWVKNSKSDTFLNYKSFRICGISGDLGPKRKEGDHQIPEGAYFIDEFNPKSNYYLSMLINYPNFSDLKYTSNPAKPGGDIYLHGSCATVGCIPINDEGIKELYLLSMMARSNGQSHIPVHIFPVRYDQHGMQKLGSIYKESKDLVPHWLTLKKLYDYFEKYHKVPVVMYDENGDYLVDE